MSGSEEELPAEAVDAALLPVEGVQAAEVRQQGLEEAAVVEGLQKRRGGNER